MTKTVERRESITGAQRNNQSFDQWAHSYDAERNPLLELEQRYLERMLPPVSERDVLDAGCGSGRWLSRLSTGHPRTLRGLDASEAMLRMAAKKYLAGVDLVEGSCESLPFADQSFDLILASFVLSYLDLNLFATESSRVARAGCDLFLSDMHQVTQRELGWKRAFHNGERAIELETTTHELRDIVDIFVSLGWEVRAAIQPGFAAPEREIFAARGRLNSFHEAAGSPAIYLLHLHKPAAKQDEAGEHKLITLRGAQCCLGPDENVPATLQIEAGRIAHITSERPSRSQAPSLDVDLSGYLLLPGFVNAHDHLEFALFPRLGNPPYRNASDWARNIHQTSAELIATHKRVPKDVRLWWGALRNLLCGVTTVCHHNPAEPEFDRDDFPVRVVRRFGWEHSIAFGEDPPRAHAATPADAPFVIHACEGTDEKARNEVWDLDRLGILDANTVLIHGLAIDDTCIPLLRSRQTALVLCPSSNDFLFGKTPSAVLTERIPNIALGSDSPLTAAGDLLDEARFAIGACNIPPARAYAMITEAPAAILHLKNGEGSLHIGGQADLIAIRDTGRSLSERMKDLSYADIELVMLDGCVQLASPAILERLPAPVKQDLEPLSVAGVVRWLGAPVEHLLERAEAILGPGCVRLGGRTVCIPAGKESLHAG